MNVYSQKGIGVYKTKKKLKSDNKKGFNTI